LRWSQHPSGINGDNLNNIRCGNSRHFKNKNKEYLKFKINELAMNSENRYIRHLYIRKHEFKKGLPT
jgi:hypothetical protein